MHSCYIRPPCRWAFSIWGVIFLLQGAGVVYQAFELWYEDASATLLVEAIGGAVPCLSPGWFSKNFVQPQVPARCFAGYWWVLGWIAECAWQFFFQQQTRTALWICMFCLLGGLFSFANALNNLYRSLPHRVDSVKMQAYIRTFSFPLSQAFLVQAQGTARSILAAPVHNLLPANQHKHGLAQRRVMHWHPDRRQGAESWSPGAWGDTASRHRYRRR